MPFGAGQLFQGNQSLDKVMGVRRIPWHRLIVHQRPKKDPATRADGSMGLMGGLQLLLQFFDAGFPILSTAGQITNRYTQLPNLLLFLGGACFHRSRLAEVFLSCEQHSLRRSSLHLDTKTPPWRDPIPA